MLNVSLICVGRLKEPYLRDAVDEYRKRLTAFCRFTVEELEAARLTDKPSDSEIRAALSDEGARITKKIPAASRVYALCVEGLSFSSEAFAADIESAAVNGASNIVFVIGSSYGLAPEVKRRADVRMSMSAMTLPHQLARIILAEQIYRAFMINSGGKYHK